MATVLCIYHDDADGFASAYAVREWTKATNRQVEFVAAQYGDTPPKNIQNKHIFIVDFSFSRDILIEMEKEVKSLQVIDHHKTAQADLEGLVFCTFDMEKSGCVLTWEHLFGRKPPPHLFRFIQDRDLWQWQLPDSRAVSAGLFSYPHDFEVWDFLVSPVGVEQLRGEGKAILRYQQNCLTRALDKDSVVMVEIEGYTVPVINATHLVSELGNELALNNPFAACYFDTKDKRMFSLRSIEGRVDVAEIARRYGGGGHARAAGFTVEKPIDSIMEAQNV